MTKEEFGLIVKALKAVYPEPSFIPDKDAFEIWFALLSDLDYELTKNATQKFMMQSSKIPRPADIREMAMSFNYKDEMSEMEVWGLVAKAITAEFQSPYSSNNSLSLPRAIFVDRAASFRMSEFSIVVSFGTCTLMPSFLAPLIASAAVRDHIPALSVLPRTSERA